jgi:large subunit ribosomal protein L32
MAVPKRRTSKSRKGMRRSHHRLTLPPIVKCANCSNLHVRHTICSECGHYRGKPILTAVEEI